MKLLVCYNKFRIICNSDNIVRAHIFFNKLIKSVANLLHVGVRLDNNISLHMLY